MEGLQDDADGIVGLRSHHRHRIEVDDVALLPLVSTEGALVLRPVALVPGHAVGERVAGLADVSGDGAAGAGAGELVEAAADDDAAHRDLGRRERAHYQVPVGQGKVDVEFLTAP